MTNSHPEVRTVYFTRYNLLLFLGTRSKKKSRLIFGIIVSARYHPLRKVSKKKNRYHRLHKVSSSPRPSSIDTATVSRFDATKKGIILSAPIQQIGRCFAMALKSKPNAKHRATRATHVMVSLYRQKALMHSLRWRFLNIAAIKLEDPYSAYFDMGTEKMRKKRIRAALISIWARRRCVRKWHVVLIIKQ
jgi:hypothetical protein